jgi:hypothetical protein
MSLPALRAGVGLLLALAMIIGWSLGIGLPLTWTKVPASPEWLHETKYDGYRLRLERDGDGERLITRGGYNWTDRYPWIVEAARKIRQKQFVLDGEAVILGRCATLIQPTTL